MDDLIVIGAGIVGLATARAVRERHPDAAITIVEKADAVATGQTGHNSGVIHAGIYYAPGSLKARLCRAGRLATIDLCERLGVRYRLVGKLVVATEATELGRLDALEGRARANGIELERIGAEELAEREPAVRGVSAIWSPGTGIVDYPGLAEALRRELEADGVTVRLGAAVAGIREEADAVTVTLDGGEELRAARLAACAGLQADRVAALGGVGGDVRIVPFRGEYFELAARRSDLVRHLVYPVPDPAMPFLGVHLSPTIDGRVTAGPNAVLGLAREGYPRGSLNPRDVAALAAFPGFWRMGMRHLRAAAVELRNSAFRRGYLAECRRYAPSLELADLGRRSAGIRAQAVGRDGTLVEDFLIERTARQVHVLNAPSPAATSAIPIGRDLAARLDKE